MEHSRDDINKLMTFYCSRGESKLFEHKVVFCDGIENYINCIKVFKKDKILFGQIVYNAKNGKVSSYIYDGETKFSNLSVVDLVLEWINLS